jgi:rusticyanin
MSPNRARLAVIASVVVIGVAGIGVAVAVGNDGSSSTTVSADGSQSSYSYYQSMMGRFQSGSMMGGSSGSMMGTTGYRWMMGGASAPQWMRGDALPGYMMGTSSDPGQVMGKLFANAPGPRVSPADATRLGNQIPTGATVDAARHTLSFAGTTDDLVVLASPSTGPNEAFRIAGMVNPTITVRSGARVSIELINTDSDIAHGLVVTTAGSSSSSMPMRTDVPAFAGSALWFLGNPTSSGAHAGTLRFTATTAGTYRYICPLPGHAEHGMSGSFIVTSS